MSKYGEIGEKRWATPPCAIPMGNGEIVEIWRNRGIKLVGVLSWFTVSHRRNSRDEGKLCKYSALAEIG